MWTKNYILETSAAIVWINRFLVFVNWFEYKKGHCTHKSFFSNIKQQRIQVIVVKSSHFLRIKKTANISIFIIQCRNSPKICINKHFYTIKLNIWHMVPVPKIQLILVCLINDHLALQKALNSQASYINVLVVHKNYIQEWFDCIRNDKAFCLVTVPKNLANFGLTYKWKFGLIRDLKFLIKVTCMCWQDTKSTFSNDVIKLEKSKFCG